MPVKAIILSLPKDLERRQLCQTELESLGMPFEFSDAPSGAQLNSEDMLRHYDAEQNRAKFKRPLSRNEIACALGHRQIWQKIVESDAPVSLVLEDDATFVNDPTRFLNTVAQSAECFEGILLKLDGLPGNRGQALRDFAGQTLVLSDRLPPRTTGYLIGRGAAKQLLAIDAPIARPIDIDLKFYWEHNVPILTLDQMMIAERQELDSNIETLRNSKKPGSSARRFFRNLLYQLNFTYGRLRHPLKPDMIDGLELLLNPGKGARNWT